MSYDIKGMSKEEVEKLLSSDFVNGLDADAVNARSRRRKEGRLPERELSFSRTLRGVLGRPSVFMFAFLIALSLFTSTLLQSLLLILSAILFYSALVLVLHTTKTDVYKYRKPFEHIYSVIRAGKVTRVRALSLLEGDILLLKAGEVTPGRCYIFAVSEDFSLEGKTPLAEMGTRILSGSCRCALCEICDEKTQVKSTDGFVSKTKKQADTLSCITYALFFVFLLVSFFVTRDGHLAFSCFELFVIIVASAVFENIDIFLDILYKRTFVAKNQLCALDGFGAIEKISELDCLAFDGDYLFDGERFAPKAFFCDGAARLLEGGKIYNNPLFEAMTLLEGNIPSSVIDFDYDKHLAYFMGKFPHHAMSYRLKEASFPFDTVAIEDENSKTAYIRGELDRVLDCCSRVVVNGITTPLDAGTVDSILKSANEFLKRDYSIFAYARTQNPDLSLKATQTVHRKLTFCGFLVCKKSVSKKGVELLEKCAVNDIQSLIFMDGDVEKVGHFFADSKELSSLKLVDCRSINADASTLKQLISNYDVFLNASVELRSLMCSYIAKSGYKLGVFNSEKMPICFDGECTLFCDSEGQNNCDVSAVLYNGIASLGDALDKTEAFITKASMAIEYSGVSTLLKLFVFFISFFVGNSLITTVQALTLAFVCDLAVVHLILGSEMKAVRQVNYAGHHKSIVKQIATVAITVSAVALASLFAFWFNDITYFDAIVSISFVLEVLFSASYVLFYGKSLKKEKSLYFLWLALLFLLGCAFLHFLGAFFGVFGGVLTILLALAVFAVYLILTSIIK